MSQSQRSRRGQRKEQITQNEKVPLQAEKWIFRNIQTVRDDDRNIVVAINNVAMEQPPIVESKMVVHT